MKIINQESTVLALMIVKPDGMLYLSKILQCLVAHNITLLSCKHLQITPEQAAGVYQEQSDRYYFSALIEYLTMGKSMVFAIKGLEGDIVNAKKSIRIIARENAIHSQQEALINFLKAMTVTEKMKSNIADKVNQFQIEYQRTFDGIHCSDPGCGERELGLFFHETDWIEPTLNSQQTCETIRHKLDLRTTATSLKAPAEVADPVCQLGHN